MWVYECIWSPSQPPLGSGWQPQIPPHASFWAFLCTCQFPPWKSYLMWSVPLPNTPQQELVVEVRIEPPPNPSRPTLGNKRPNTFSWFVLTLPKPSFPPHSWEAWAAQTPPHASFWAFPNPPHPILQTKLMQRSAWRKKWFPDVFPGSHKILLKFSHVMCPKNGKTLPVRQTHNSLVMCIKKT